MAKEVKVIALANQQVLISEIEEVGSADIGEPDCKLINPFVIISSVRRKGTKLTLAFKGEQ